MNTTAIAINTLRERIRSARTQYRFNNDNSPSLFHPAKGFTYGYDIEMVEAALDVFESETPSEFEENAEVTL